MSIFHRDILESLTLEKKQLRATELAAYLSERLAAADDFDGEIERIVASLREQGHDIWSWDYDDGRQVWGPDYQRPPMTGLVIEFYAPSLVTAQWIENVDGAEVRQVFGEGLT